MIFTISNQSEPLVRLALPNDGEFKRLYREAYERIMRAQEAARNKGFFKRFLGW
jgi:hypothetical protein